MRSATRAVISSYTEQSSQRLISAAPPRSIVLTVDVDPALYVSNAIPAQSGKRLAFFVRASGSRVPVSALADPSGEREAFVDATLEDDPTTLLTGSRDMLAQAGTKFVAPRVFFPSSVPGNRRTAGDVGVTARAP
jgi:hypothetical protein